MDPHGGYRFSGLTCAVAGRRIYFSIGTVHVCDGREVKGLIHDIGHGARMILRDMSSWVAGVKDLGNI